MSIFPDKKGGKLTGRYRVELQANGARIRERYDTLPEARAAEARYRLEIAKGKMPEKARQRVEKGPQLETLAQLCKAVEGHLWAGKSTERQTHQRLGLACEIVGLNSLVEAITVADLDRLVTVLRKKQNAPGTINRYLSAFNVAMKWALKRGYRVSPLPELDWQDEDEGRIRWITPTEEATLLPLLAVSERAACYVAMRTGLRRAELLNLLPRDVELGWVHLWGTGTKSGKGRSIPLTYDVYQALQEMFKAGKPTIETLRYQWAKAREAMGLLEDEDFVFHSTRHTFATRAVQAGVHPRILQRLMGHKHLSTTMRYMQVSDGMLSAAIEQMAVTQAPSVTQDPTGTLVLPILMGSPVGALQGAVNPLNPPLARPDNSLKTLRHQGVRLDLGSSGETRGGSNPSARTTVKTV